MKLFDRNIEPSCAYCRYGMYIGQNEVACLKQGITAISGSCGKFRYEPTKREPAKARRLGISGLTEEDFALD